MTEDSQCHVCMCNLEILSDLKQAATGLPDNTMPTRKAEQGQRRRQLMGLMHCGLEMWC